VESESGGEEQLDGILEAVEVPRREAAEQQRRKRRVRVLEPRGAGEAGGEGEKCRREEGENNDDDGGGVCAREALHYEQSEERER